METKLIHYPYSVKKTNSVNIIIGIRIRFEGIHINRVPTNIKTKTSTKSSKDLIFTPEAFPLLEWAEQTLFIPPNQIIFLSPFSQIKI